MIFFDLRRRSSTINQSINLSCMSSFHQFDVRTINLYFKNGSTNSLISFLISVWTVSLSSLTPTKRVIFFQSTMITTSKRPSSRFHFSDSSSSVKVSFSRFLSVCLTQALVRTKFANDKALQVDKTQSRRIWNLRCQQGSKINHLWYENEYYCHVY